MRRILTAIAFAAAALAPASFAAAEPVSVAPISIAPELQEKFTDEFGEREVAYLQDYITRRVTADLERHGASVVEGAPLIVEVTLVDADPNKPTFKQMTDTPGLDYFSSISIGGAELTAVLRRADGSVAGDVNYRRWSQTLEFVDVGGGPWSEARRAVRTFSDRVADAYVDAVGVTNQ